LILNLLYGKRNLNNLWEDPEVYGFERFFRAIIDFYHEDPEARFTGSSWYFVRHCLKDSKDFFVWNRKTNILANLSPTGKSSVTQLLGGVGRFNVIGLAEIKPPWRDHRSTLSDHIFHLQK